MTFFLKGQRIPNKIKKMVLGAGKIYLSHKRLKLILPGIDILTVSEMDTSLFLKIKTTTM